MEGILAILCAVGGPFIFLILRTYWREQNRRRELELRSGHPLQLAAVQKEKEQLEGRLANLEQIVTSVDFELIQRLSRLAAGEEERRAALPAPGPGTAPTEARLQPSLAERSRRVEYRHGVLTAGQVVLGRYTVERELGRGGMGAVYLARDATLGERVALKVISAMYSGNPEEAVTRFKREVTAARRISHPNVIRIHDLGEDGALLFLSMEHVDGDTLEGRVGRSLPSVHEACDILAQVSAGIAAAHAAGVIHRDLKPQNVLLGKNGSVKVIDFGLAKSDLHGSGTATGVIMGTPEYMAPEQVRGRPCDARTDVYALGATAYFVLTGRPPFTGESPIAISFAQVNDPPRPLRELRPEIPADLELAVLRALEKDAIRRFPDAAAFRAALGV
jgi:serine/threonine-protein kinase